MATSAWLREGMTRRELVCPTITCPFLVHWMVGEGLPSASHLSITLLPAPEISFSGAWLKVGATRCSGREAREVASSTTGERARPRALVASQW